MSGAKFIGPYRIVEILGQGGMGVVYRGEDPRTGAQVALKTVKVPNAKLVQVIRREIRSLALIRHPGIVPIVEEGLHEGIPWYAMEFLEGPTLRRWMLGLATPHSGPADGLTRRVAPETTLALEEPSATRTLDLATPYEAVPAEPPEAPRSRLRPLDPEALRQILGMACRLCAPLAFLHGEGMVHRDLKPENILIRADGQPVLMDFGLAARFGGDVSREALDVERDIVGTVAYISPEQALGDLVDARADLYSLGCILYELLTGRPPFVGSSPGAVIAQHLHAEPMPLSAMLDKLPEELEALVSRLLRKAPRERFGYADDVAAQLLKLGADVGDSAHDPGTRPRAYLYRPGFSGHQAVMRELEGRLRSISRKDAGPCLALLGGESGSGKTRVAIELASLAASQRIRAIAGECSLAEPLHPFRSLLQRIGDQCRERGPQESQRLLGRRRPLLSLYEPSLQEVPGLADEPPLVELPPEAARLRLFSYLEETLAALSAESPLLLVLDDLQWADELTLGFLAFLASTKIHARLLLLATYRVEDLGDSLDRLLELPSFERFELKRFDEAAVSSMVGDMLAMDPPPRNFCRFLSRHSEGNPFFVAEYLRTAVAEGILFRAEDGYWQVSAPDADETAEIQYEKLPLPGSIKNLVERRLERLERPSRLLAEIASVQGREVDYALLARVAGPELIDALAKLLRWQILEETGPGSLSFAHDKIREVAYEGIEETERRGWHRQTASAMEEMPQDFANQHMASLGHHWEKAGRLDLARERYLAGARRERERYASASAERLYRDYLRLSESVSAETIDARYELAYHLLRTQGRLEQALEQHQLALDEARSLGDQAREAQHLLGLGTIHQTAGRGRQAQEFYAEALRIARKGGHRRPEGMALCNLALVLRNQGGFDEAHHLYDEALPILREVGDPRLESMALSNWGDLMADQERLREAEDLYTQALSIQRLTGDRRGEGNTLGNLFGLFMERKMRESTQRALAEEALKIHREVGHRLLEATTLNNLLVLSMDCGDLKEALSIFSQAMSIASTISNLFLKTELFRNGARLHRLMGDLDRAGRLLDEMRPWIDKMGDGIQRLFFLCEEGHLALALGQPAKPHLEQAEQLLGRLGLGPETVAGESVEQLRASQGPR